MPTIEAIADLGFTNVDCYPLHGDLSPEDQDKIFAQTPAGRIKIIVSTNVAETSITVPGVTMVIDSGIVRQVEYDDNTGIEALKTRRHAKSGLIQRAGRAGRVAPGSCYRLFTEEEFNGAANYQVPEIQRSNLAHVVLQMKKNGHYTCRRVSFCGCS
jgi:HrpA-like RNA helicase